MKKIHPPLLLCGYARRMAKVQRLSEEAHQRLLEEHTDLTTRGRIEIARKIETARELGDLSENGDYQAAKEEQGKMETRIAQLASILQNVEIVSKAEVDSEKVSLGVIVSLLYEGDQEPEKMLVGSIEEKHENLEVLSPESPLGEALLGASVGETVTFEAPNGDLTVKVVEIEG